ncbi:MAG: DUF480 domain-containing protein [Candidatus Endonucleobacter bathymodioli]|uniref:DUF480 domain-containing protein n=1 Tax=Candidatus Endonucleibacter bathymodioli TaxID=539814 RepID=A0AA90SXX7_9GAMM|nr:DUF480 domain-containing protein [Candidatus Endonucleobacter bathymodioli]
MDMDLTLNDTRIIGCLLEKESTTPDQYPLSLNALTNACNQKSNREPVMALSQSDVLNIVDCLKVKLLISEENRSRVSKYKHRFCNTEFSDLQLSDQERAILGIMFLRGPQTPGELRGRTGRMATFVDANEVDLVLKDMEAKDWVACLPREAGKRESRYFHLFSGNIEQPIPLMQEVVVDDKARIEELEHEIITLKAEIELLKHGCN